MSGGVIANLDPPKGAGRRAHTPGPWKAGRPDMATIVDGFNSKWVYAGNKYIAVASGQDIRDWDEVMANAHLIAAAPDFYDVVNGQPEDVSPIGWLIALVQHYEELLDKSIEAGEVEDPSACREALSEVRTLIVGLAAASAKARGEAK